MTFSFRVGRPPQAGVQLAMTNRSMATRPRQNENCWAVDLAACLLATLNGRMLVDGRFARGAVLVAPWSFVVLCVLCDRILLALDRPAPRPN